MRQLKIHSYDAYDCNCYRLTPEQQEELCNNVNKLIDPLTNGEFQLTLKIPHIDGCYLFARGAAMITINGVGKNALGPTKV